MKYFTKEWCFGDLDDDVVEERLEKYREYIKNIYSGLPFVLKILAKDLNLHDGIIKKITYSNTKFMLEGIFGDLQIGYFFLKIKYLNIFPIFNSHLISVFKNKTLEILSDEIEIVQEGHYIHKLLFSTKQEIEIAFKDLAIEIRSSSPQNYKKKLCKLKII